MAKRDPSTGRFGRLTREEREGLFWSLVDRRVGPEACWLWRGAINSDGYGCLNRARADRLAYIYCRGPIPSGLTIDHLCRVRQCVNPWHLEVVTNKENCLRGISRSAMNARKTHCLHGHELSRENIYLPPSGGRHCRICLYARMRAKRLSSGLKQFLPKASE